jgi:hypothetical protein
MQNKEGRIKNIKKIIIAAGILSEHTCCFWRADFHGQGATLVTPDNLMYSLPTI